MTQTILRDNLDRLPEVMYFTDSFLTLHIDCKSNAFFCICFKSTTFVVQKSIHRLYEVATLYMSFL